MKSQLKLAVVVAVCAAATMFAKNPAHHGMKHGKANGMQKENTLVIVAEGNTPVLVSVERKSFGKNEIIQEATLKKMQNGNNGKYANNGKKQPSNKMTINLGDLKPYQAVYVQHDHKLIVRLDDSEYKHFLVSGRMKFREENRDLAVTLFTQDGMSQEHLVAAGTTRLKVNSADVAKLVINADNMTLDVKTFGAVRMKEQQMQEPRMMQQMPMEYQKPMRQPMMENQPMMEPVRPMRASAAQREMEENDDWQELATTPDALETE